MVVNTEWYVGCLKRYKTHTSKINQKMLGKQIVYKKLDKNMGTYRDSVSPDTDWLKSQQHPWETQCGFNYKVLSGTEMEAPGHGARQKY